MKEIEVVNRVYDRRRLVAAWQQVKKNAGAAGIDRMSIEDFDERKEELFPIIYRKLQEGTYRFKPARRVLIPKDGGGHRKLGIPCIMDRIVSQSMSTVLEEIFDKDFTESNFGFRKGKSQHNAIKSIQAKVQEDKSWGVSIDLKSFFDEIPHGLILKLIRRKIYDEQFVTLIARSIKAGVIVDGQLEKTTKGTPQGSPISPILSNIVLNELDHELERRGLNYCRWADDFVVVLGSERAGLRVMKGITGYIEEELGLPVNKEKSKVAYIKDITFLGFKLLRGMIRISEKALERFKRRVRELTRRNNPLSMHQIIQELNKFLRGWVNYFRIQQFKRILRNLDEWIRGRLRSMQLKKWKKPKRFQHMMILAGYKPEEAKKIWVRMNRWQSVQRRVVKFTMNLQWFRDRELIFLDDWTIRSS